MYIVPKRYDPESEEMVPVTQEWVDLVQQRLAAFVNAREALRVFLNPWWPEFEQKGKG